MPKFSLLCRTATPFSESGELDEHALRQFLQRFVDAKLGVCLASGGAGEGNTLSIGELRRIYEIGVAECKGKVPVYANPPEQHSAEATIEHALLAIQTGIEIVNIFPVAGVHGMNPREAELLAYYEEVFATIKHPVALSVNPIVGYVPTAAFIADICRRYPQVVEINLTRVNDTYLLNLKRSIDRDLAYYVELPGSLNAFLLGANGLVAASANIIPKTYRQYLDLYERKELDKMGSIYAHLLRYNQYVQKWSFSNARWIKMAMKVLKLPGGNGGLRKPYIMPDADELQTFTTGLLQLGIPEIEEQARVAGLSV